MLKAEQEEDQQAGNGRKKKDVETRTHRCKEKKTNKKAEEEDSPKRNPGKDLVEAAKLTVNGYFGPCVKC